MRLAAPAVPIGAVLIAGCSGPPAPAPPPFKPVADVLTLMVDIIDPSSNVVFGSAGEFATAAGTEERMSGTEEEWARVRTAALTVAEAGNLLMMPTRARDNEEWMAMSRAMIDGGEAAAKAAVAKDPKAIVAAGDQIYLSCDACHKKYIVVPPGG
jgi:hypothetical protein